MRLIRRISGFLWLTGALILTHLIARSIFPENNVAVDLLLFNSIGVMASVIAFNAPLHTDRISANSFGAAALVWSMGSFFSTWNSFFELQIPAAIFIHWYLSQLQEVLPKRYLCLPLKF